MRNLELSKKTIQIGRPAGRNKKNDKIKLIYKKLYRSFGRQGWWPVSIKKGEEPVYRKGIYKPLNKREAFEIAIGAILTQNTSWNNVKLCIKNLSQNNMIDLLKIIKLDEEKIYPLIKSSGYYKQKAIKLKNLAIWWLKNIKKINKLKTKELRESLLSVKGIGPETADSILLYAFKRATFVIDAYTKRIYSRVTDKNEEKYETLKSIFENSLPRSIKIYNEYHALLVELAKRNCKKKFPLCLNCPLENICEFFKEKYGNRK